MSDERRCRAGSPVVPGFVLGRLYPRTLAPATSVPRADMEHDLPFSCFPEIVRIWDGVSQYILRQLALNKVAFALSSSPPTLLAAGVLNLQSTC